MLTVSVVICGGWLLAATLGSWAYYASGDATSNAEI
jgi:hypothetical protein